MKNIQSISDTIGFIKSNTFFLKLQESNDDTCKQASNLKEI